MTPTSGAGRPWAPWTPWQRTARFAARLTGRHGAHRGRQPSAGRVFVRAAVASPRAGWALVGLRARIELVLAHVARASRPTHRAAGHAVVPAVFARAARLVAAVPAMTAGATAVAARVTARTARVERGDSSHGRPLRAGAPGVAVPAAPRVARVVRRASPAAVAPPVPDDGWGTPAPLRHAALPASFPPAELDRLADHVMQTMDRRLHAHRERRGRS